MAIQTFSLDNGMQTLLEENHAARVISFNALVKVGSASETDDEAGICHVIEHMLFKGTPTRPMGTIARDVEAAGGEINAYTSIDQTVYYINMAVRFADRGLEILADAIRNPLFDAEEFAREKEVILEEIRREKDNPSRMSSEMLFQSAYRRHTYGRPIIGYPKTVGSFTRDELLEFHKRWYTPKNIVLIAVGNFEAKKMMERIRGEFAGWSGPRPPDVSIPAEPPQARPRLVVKTMNIQNAHMAMGYHIPSITHEDIPALDILAHVLGGAESSRLEQEIKEKQHLVHNIFAYSFTPKHPGMFIVGATLADKDAARTIAAINKELNRVKEHSVTSGELARAKLNIRSNEIYDKETVGGQASKIVSFVASAGSHEFEARYYHMLADVCAEKVQEAAARYLTSNNSTTVLIVPENSSWVRSKARLSAGLASKGSRARRAAAPRAHRTHFVRLKNGAKLILIEKHDLPLVFVCAVAKGGTRSERKATNGVSNLMARMLTKGTRSRSAVRVAQDIEKLAGHIDGFSGHNAVGLKCEFLSEHLHEGFSLFADCLCHPTFSKTEVKKEKRVVIKAIEDQEDHLSSRVFAEFLKTLYPKHPYGLRTLGTKESVSALEQKDLAAYHRNIMRAKNMVLTVVGDANRKEIEGMANEFLADLPEGKTSIGRIIADPVPAKSRESTIVKHRKEQAHIVMGFMGTTFKNPDRYAMAVFNNIMSGQGGRLFVMLRDRMGLAYAVNSVNHEGIEPGYFAVYIGTEPGKIKTAIDGILAELARVRGEKVSAAELERSKQYLVGTYELDLQRNSMVANIYAFNELYGLDMKEIEEYPQRIMDITRDDVLRVARKYIRPKAYVLAVIKPK